MTKQSQQTYEIIKLEVEALKDAVRTIKLEINGKKNKRYTIKPETEVKGCQD